MESTFPRYERQLLSANILNRLLKPAFDQKKYFPKILSNSKVSHWFFIDPKYVILAFFDENNLNRVSSLRKEGFDPFPGLITHDNSIKTAFIINNSKYIQLNNCHIKNMYSILLGIDSTAILENFKQSIQIKDKGNYEYMIDLGYIVSLGNEINKSNIRYYFEDLITYSIMEWVKKDV